MQGRDFHFQAGQVGQSLPATERSGTDFQPGSHRTDLLKGTRVKNLKEYDKIPIIIPARTQDGDCISMKRQQLLIGLGPLSQGENIYKGDSAEPKEF